MWIEREDGKEMVGRKRGGDMIYRQDAIDVLKRNLNETDVPDHYPGIFNAIKEWLSDRELPSAQPEQEREFIKLTVRNSNGRPYYSIIYLELDDNGVGHDFEGYSSYSLDVISDYLKKYFISSAQPEQCEYYALCRHGMDENKLRADLGVCEYCNEDSDGYVKPIEKNNHAFVRFGMNGWELDLKANGWHGSAKIRYCPMCGRDLLAK